MVIRSIYIVFMFEDSHGDIRLILLLFQLNLLDHFLRESSQMSILNPRIQGRQARTMRKNLRLQFYHFHQRILDQLEFQQ